MILTMKMASTKNKIKEVFFSLINTFVYLYADQHSIFKNKKKLTKWLTTFLFGGYNTNYSDSMIGQFYFHNDKTYKIVYHDF